MAASATAAPFEGAAAVAAERPAGSRQQAVIGLVRFVTRLTSFVIRLVSFVIRLVRFATRFVSFVTRFVTRFARCLGFRGNVVNVMHQIRGQKTIWGRSPQASFSAPPT